MKNKIKFLKYILQYFNIEEKDNLYEVNDLKLNINDLYQDRDGGIIIPFIGTFKESIKNLRNTFILIVSLIFLL